MRYPPMTDDPLQSFEIHLLGDPQKTSSRFPANFICFVSQSCFAVITSQCNINVYLTSIPIDGVNGFWQ